VAGLEPLGGREPQEAQEENMNGIKLALMEAGKPQYVVARQAGIDETRLSRLATGRAKPTKDELKTLAATLGVPPSKLEK